MIPMCDYHMHTPLCGHAEGAPEDYARRAVEAGLKEIGFSDHAPLISHDVPNVSMGLNDLPVYHQMIESVRTQFAGQLQIKIALEADFVPGFEAQTKNILDAYPYDYIIGSVHFLDDWGFDNPAEQGRWDSADINQVYRRYYDLLRRSARSGMFNIMGHVDLVKKFGHRSSEDITDDITATAKAFKESGVVVEINTAGLRKPVGEMYPALAALKIYRQAGVPLTFGSDAHTPQDVGRDFDRAVDLAKAAGYEHYVTFKNRRIAESIHL